MNIFLRVAASLVLFNAAGVQAADQLETLAEKSGWTQTGRYDETIALCDRFAKAFPMRAK